MEHVQHSPSPAHVVLQRRIPILRQRLVERRRELLSRVARTDDDLRWLDTNVAPERQEEAHEERRAQLLASLGQLERAEIADIDAALRRIATDHYGRCSSCGGAIDAPRLEALPHASTCLGCAEVREGSGLKA